MNATWKHPTVLTLSGLIALLTAGLVVLTDEFQERRDRYFDASLPSVPTDRQIAKIAGSVGKDLA